MLVSYKPLDTSGIFIHSRQMIRPALTRCFSLFQAKLYVQEGADLNDIDPDGQTMLHHAVSIGDVAMAKWLLENGANVNAADTDDETPLLAAAKHGLSVEMIPLLVNFGADVTSRNVHHSNALNLISSGYFKCEEDRVYLAEFLIQKGVTVNDELSPYPPIEDAILANRKELVSASTYLIFKPCARCAPIKMLSNIIY